MTLPHEGVRWRASSKSGNTNCVELGDGDRGVRDSKNQTGPILALPWSSLVAAVKSNQITR